MKYLFYFCWILLGVWQTLTAQDCQNCPKTNEKTDFCYKNTDFPKQCARFSQTADLFYVYNQKQKVIKLRIPENPTPYLIQLAENKKLKFAISDILFIQKALDYWENRPFTEGFDTTKLGIGIKIIQEGKGKIAQKNQKIRFRYIGKFEDGHIFDSSLERKTPYEGILGEGKLIKGLDEGLVGLQVGTKALLKIPPKLGYGEQSYGKIPAGTTLYYEIFILQVE